MRVEEKDQGQTATTLCQTDRPMNARCLMAKGLPVTEEQTVDRTGGSQTRPKSVLRKDWITQKMVRLRLAALNQPAVFTRTVNPAYTQ